MYRYKQIPAIFQIIIFKYIVYIKIFAPGTSDLSDRRKFILFNVFKTTILNFFFKLVFAIKFLLSTLLISLIKFLIFGKCMFKFAVNPGKVVFIILFGLSVV
jgi:hypothetical protein